MIGRIQKKLITLMLVFVLVMPCYIKAMVIIPDRVVQGIGVLPVVLSCIGAKAQPLPGNCLAILGAGACAGSTLYAVLREYTPNQIIYRGKELAEFLQYQSSINHIITTENDITPDIINQIPGYSFKIAEDECDKFVPIIKKHLYWIQKTGVETQEKKDIAQQLTGYEKRMGILCSVIKKNNSEYTQQDKKNKNKVNEIREQQKHENDLQNEQLNARATWFNAMGNYWANMLPWSRHIIKTAVLLPTLFIIFKVTLKFARLV
jgi:hypothetical protein